MLLLCAALVGCSADASSVDDALALDEGASEVSMQDDVDAGALQDDTAHDDDAPADAAEADDAARVPEIRNLLSEGGSLSTEQMADPEPQRLSESVENLIEAQNGEFACTEAEYSLTKVPERFVALNPNADVLWPGSLVQGKSLGGGVLDPIPVDRAPGSITLTLSSGGGGLFSRTLASPSLSSATQAQNEILAEYEGATPAKFSYSGSSVYSSEQLAVAVDANVQGTNWSASAALAFDSSDTKSRYLIQFTQEYYTMAFTPPNGAAGTFAPHVTAADLAPYTGPSNPIVYVGSVTYGRIFYLLFESSASQMQLEAAIKAAYSAAAISASGSVDASYRKVINESSVKAYGIGGNARDAITAATGSELGSGQGSEQFDVIRTFLTAGANFGPDSPGVPISYTVRHLADLTQVKLALTTEYTAKNCVPVQRGCDGVRDSNAVADRCGVCGGNGQSCYCQPRVIRHDPSGSSAFVTFDVPKNGAGEQPAGSIIEFSNGRWHKLSGLCQAVYWSNVRYQCVSSAGGGYWAAVTGTRVTGDHNCPTSSNNDQQGVRVGLR
jgi:thiol-activated cytolysin